MEISKEEFVERVLERTVRQEGDIEYHRPRAELEYEWITGMYITFLDKAKWERVKELIEQNSCQGCWGFGNKECLVSCKARNILVMLRKEMGLE